MPGSQRITWSFPMFVLPITELLKMTQPSHQSLRAAAFCWSTKFVGCRHPSPNFEQFQAFISAIECLLNCVATACFDPFSGLAGGVKPYKDAQLESCL